MKHDQLIKELGFRYCHVSDESLQFLLNPTLDNWLTTIPKELRLIINHILANELIFRPKNATELKETFNMIQSGLMFFYQPNNIEGFLHDMYIIDDEHPKKIEINSCFIPLNIAYDYEYCETLDFVISRDRIVNIRLGDRDVERTKYHRNVSLENITIYKLVRDPDAQLSECAKFMRNTHFYKND